MRQSNWPNEQGCKHNPRAASTARHTQDSQMKINTGTLYISGTAFLQLQLMPPSHTSNLPWASILSRVSLQHSLTTRFFLSLIYWFPSFCCFRVARSLLVIRCCSTLSPVNKVAQEGAESGVGSAAVHRNMFIFQLHETAAETADWFWKSWFVTCFHYTGNVPYRFFGKDHPITVTTTPCSLSCNVRKRHSVQPAESTVCVEQIHRSCWKCLVPK